MSRLRPWIVPGLLAIVAVVLLTRIPLIAVIAKDEDKGVPDACKVEEPAFRAALERAPAPVRVGDARLSQCLARSSSAAEVQQVGQIFVGVASGLSDEARRRPNGRAAVQLGYLVGAVRRGTSASQGIYVTLRQRIEQEALTLDRDRGFRTGERAGRASG